MRKLFNNKKFLMISYLIIFLMIFFLNSYLRYPEEELLYKNIDATYHQLLTSVAYEENILSEHKLLPIVTLGDKGDKFIKWGSTIPDDSGNYFYTSFYSIGFLAPFIFFKVTKSEINIYNMYIFNTFLFLIFIALAVYLVYMLAKSNKQWQNLSIHIKSLFLFSVSIIIMFAPEIMHGMGVIYWHHSLFQVSVALQFILFHKIYFEENKYKWIYVALFYFMCILCPLIEWTGYIVNAGLVLAIILFNKSFTKQKNDKACYGRQYIRNCFHIIILTLLSIAIMTHHFFLVTDFKTLFDAIEKRFLSRSSTAYNLVHYKSLDNVYFNGFSIILIGFLICLVAVLINKKTRKSFFTNIKHYSLWIFIFVFMMLENIIMIRHATIYTYDIMKLIFIILILYTIIVLSFSTFENRSFTFKIFKKKLFLFTGKSYMYLIICLIILSSVLSGWSYLRGTNTYYMTGKIYPIELREYMSEYISSNYNYENSLLSANYNVRGYQNLSYGRGIIELFDMDYINGTNQLNSDKRYLINLRDSINYIMYASCNIYDTELNTYTHWGSIYSGEIITYEPENLYLGNTEEVEFLFNNTYKKILEFDIIMDNNRKIEELHKFISENCKTNEYGVFSYKYSPKESTEN